MERSRLNGCSSTPQLSPDELVGAAAWDLEAERLDRAIEVAKRAAAAGAGAEAHIVIGNALMKQRNCKAAEREFARASDLDPGNQLAQRRAQQARACIIQAEE